MNATVFTGYNDWIAFEDRLPAVNSGIVVYLENNALSLNEVEPMCWTYFFYWDNNKKMLSPITADIQHIIDKLHAIPIAWRYMDEPNEQLIARVKKRSVKYIALIEDILPG